MSTMNLTYKLIWILLSIKKERLLPWLLKIKNFLMKSDSNRCNKTLQNEKLSLPKEKSTRMQSLIRERMLLKENIRKIKEKLSKIWNSKEIRKLKTNSTSKSETWWTLTSDKNITEILKHKKDTKSLRIKMNPLWIEILMLRTETISSMMPGSRTTKLD